MSQKAKNIAAVKAIRYLLEQIRIADDAEHDAVMFTYTDRKDFPRPALDELQIMGGVTGCPCTIVGMLTDMAKNIPEFAVALLGAAKLYLKQTGQEAQTVLLLEKLLKDKPLHVVDETQKN
jgi:hypothetical protein